MGHLLPSCSLVQHVWFTPKNGNAGELCATEKKCHKQTSRKHGIRSVLATAWGHVIEQNE